MGYSLVLYVLGRQKTSTNTCEVYIGSVWKGRTTQREEVQEVVLIGQESIQRCSDWQLVETLNIT